MNKEFKLLVNVETEMIADEIIELLEHNDIKAFKEYDDTGMSTLIYMNKPLTGVGLEVEKEDFEKAKELINAYFEELKTEE